MCLFDNLLAFNLDIHLWEAGVDLNEGDLFAFSLDLSLLFLKRLVQRLFGLLNQMMVSHFRDLAAYLLFETSWVEVKSQCSMLGI